MNGLGKYLSMVKFSHTIFAMPFALVGFFLAISQEAYAFSWETLALVLACMVFARNAAMGFNRYIDRDIDAANPRTAEVREIPNGSIRPQSALVFVIINSIAFLTCTWFINPLCFYIAPFALLVVLGYSYTKRFTALCHLVLGLGLAIAPFGAYLAVTGVFDWLPIGFSALVLFWVAGFDIIYALQDEGFDKTQNLHSIPVLLGRKGALRLSQSFHILCIGLLVALAIYGPFGTWFYVGAAAFSALLIYQHQLVSVDDLSRVNLAFFTTNGVGSVLFGALVIADLYL